MNIYGKWEAVIGLEIHVQLNTKTKLFSRVPNRFGDEPNTNIGPVCTGQPGSLPTLNLEAVRKAVQFGCAVGSHINLKSQFDRKSYFYPDCPRNFQITQYYHPILVGGSVVADVDGTPMTFQIHHAHLEDDAGMLKHFSAFAGVDYNRSGTALLEIVSEPCMRSVKEASSYAKAIRAIMAYLDASDCNMEEGSLRFDANCSVRLHQETTLRPKTEIKNMNSFAFMELALDAEIRRQIGEYERHPDKKHSDVIHRETYRWDPEQKKPIRMRQKESSEDYRYFPEPDLPPLVISEEYVFKIRSALPELPYQRRKRYVEELKLADHSAAILVADKALADYFEKALSVCFLPQQVCNWIIVEFFGRFKDTNTSLLDSTIPAEHVGELVRLISEGVITGKLAKTLADHMVQEPKRAPTQIVQEHPEIFKVVEDLGFVENVIDQVLNEQPQSVADYLAGKVKAFSFLIGQVMKATQGKAPPQAVNQLLKEKLEKRR